MADPTPMPGLEEKIRRVNERLKVGGGDGQGPTDDDTKFRLAALERSVEKMDGKLERIGESLNELGARLARIEAKLEQAVTAVEFAAIRGRVEALPTTWQMITLVFGILGGAFVILKFGLPHVA